VPWCVDAQRAIDQSNKNIGQQFLKKQLCGGREGGGMQQGQVQLPFVILLTNISILL